ncbi:hypothetical protein BC941DRAFT_413191 [Chlamydoabsidia padenii]|nr:hypothetical protein BC941DRAFT_413191 [Chlamydoabsidia padenii]
MASTTDLSPPPFDYDTIIRNITQANGTQVINNIDQFLTQEGITLGYAEAVKNTESIDNATLLERLHANDIVPQQTRQLVQTYFANVERMQGLETESVNALKEVELAQVSLENIIQDLEAKKNDL